MVDLQEQALAVKQPLRMNSLEQSDAEEALAEWMESANIENAWKMAPTLVSIGMDAKELECARNEFDGPLLSEALGWLTPSTRPRPLRHRFVPESSSSAAA